MKAMKSLEVELLDALDSGWSEIAEEDLVPGRFVYSIKAQLAW